MTSSSALRKVAELLAEQHFLVVQGPPGTGKSAVAIQLIANLVQDAAVASGASQREIVRDHLNRDLFVRFSQPAASTVDAAVSLRSRCAGTAGDWDVDWSGFGPDGQSMEQFVAARSGGRTVRPGEPAFTALFEFGISALANWSFKFVHPVDVLLRSLRRVIRFGRRTDVSHQLAVQRLKFACRAARLSSDEPPGEVVVASPRVPRGPDLPRVISTLLITRGERPCLA